MTLTKGGSTWSSAEYCRAACRRAIDSGYRYELVGFRAKAQPTIVARGGSWVNQARNCRAAYRYLDDPGDRWVILGFRTKA